MNRQDAKGIKKIDRINRINKNRIESKNIFYSIS